MKQRRDYWISPKGQEELARMQDARDPRGKQKTNRWSKSGKSQMCGLNIIDYTKASKASLCPVGVKDDNEWQEVVLTADTGACDTVVPKLMCPGIPIVPSLQSMQGLVYEIADGTEIPNLGEKRCEMWTEGAVNPKAIRMQVADVHKPLLSLSRCADMGFESRFGATMGCLIDTTTGEVIPLQRRGNLYVLRCWIRAAPFGRPETPS